VSDHDLQERIEASPALNAAAGQLRDEIGFRADKSVQFDPFLVVMIISIIVQVVIHCRENRTDDELRNDIRDIRTLPHRRMLRLKRRLNFLWRKHAADRSGTPGNPLLDAVYDLAEKADDAALDEIFRLARENAA